jgi:ribosomal protein L34
MDRHAVTPALSTSTLAAEFLSLDAALARTQTSAVTFDARTYSPQAIARAREVWRARMGTEYGSTTVFSQVAAQMVEAGATLDTTAVMLRMAQDELRHTRTCGEVVAALGGEARLERTAQIAPVATHASVSRTSQRDLHYLHFGNVQRGVLEHER